MKRKLAAALAALMVVLGFTGCSAEARRARMLDRAGKYYASGDYEKAKVTYLNVLGEAPDSAVAHDRLGAIWLEQGSPVRALPYLLQAQEFSPGDHTLHPRLAAALVAVERIADARKEALAGIHASTAHGEALVILSETIRSRADHDVTLAELKKSPLRNQPAGVVAFANLLLVNNDADQAEKAVVAALKRHSDASALHAALGAIHERQNDRAKAAAAWQRAAELAPARSLTRTRYAEFLARSGAVEEAKTYLQEMIRTTADFLPARRALARLLVQQKAFTPAEEQIRAMLYQDTSNIDGYLLLAEMHVAKGEMKEAIVRLAKLLSEHPKLALVSCRLSWALLQIGEVKQAKGAVQSGLRHDPAHRDSLVLLSEIHLREARPEAAVQILAQLLNDYPQDGNAQALLAEGLRALGRLEEARVVLQQRLATQPDNPQLLVLLGRILQQQGKPQEARRQFEAALERAPTDPAAVTAVVELEVKGGDYAAALRRVRAAQEHAPSAHFYSVEAGIHLAQRRWSEAETALRQALMADAGHDRTYNLLKFAYDARKQASGALAILDEVLAREAANPRALLLKAIVLSERKEFPAARAAYERLLALKPDAAVPLNNLAALCAEEPGQLDRAYTLAKKARELDPASPNIADTLGWILCQRQDYVGALELIEQAASKLPDNPEVQYHLAMANLGLARTEVARAAFKRAASATEDFPGKSDIPARLATLERGEVAQKNP